MVLYLRFSTFLWKATAPKTPLIFFGWHVCTRFVHDARLLLLLCLGVNQARQRELKRV